MGNIERSDRDCMPVRELCCSNHFYAAYVFDQAETHQKDITTIIEQSTRLGYPMRYWWLSQAMNIQGNPDRLIVCVHHPTNDENAGMDLYDVLHARDVTYAELDAAVLEEYVYLGCRVVGIASICSANGQPIFMV